MLACVPETLKQKFEYLPDNDRDLVFNNFHSSWNIKYLTQNDILTSFVAYYLHNSIIIYEAPAFKCLGQLQLPNRTIIKDVEYLPDKEYRFRLLLALSSGQERSENCIALVTLDNNELTLVQTVAIAHEILCIKVILADNDVMIGTGSENNILKDWPNLIAIGTEGAHCYLTSVTPGAKRAVILDPLAKRHRESYFAYSYFHKKRGCKTELMTLEESTVTAIGYLCKSETLVIGFGFGGLMLISFEDEVRTVCLRYLSSAPVSHITYLEPHDDPKNTVYFCVGYPDNNIDIESGVQIVLYSKVETKEILNCVFLKLTHKFPKSKNWLSMRTLCSSIPVDGRNYSNFARDTNNSQAIDRSLLFMAYMTDENKLMGHLFDLNAFYYSRLVPKVKPDRTIACQNSFLSFIWPSNRGNSDFKDVVVFGEKIYRSLSVMTNADQLYYPSNFDIPVICAFSSSKVYSFKVPAIKTQVMQRIGKHLQVCVENPYRAAECFCALGLNTDFDMHPFDVVFSSLILYNQADLVLKFIRTLGAGEPVLMKIHSCVRNIVESAKNRMDSTRPLCLQGLEEFHGVMFLFRTSKKVLDLLISISFVNGSSHQADFRVVEETRSCLENYLLYYSCILTLINREMLPLSGRTEMIHMKRKQAMSLKRKEKKEKGTKLIIDCLALEVSSPSRGEKAEDLYPPKMTGFLAPLLSADLSMKTKKKWIIYNLIDYFITEGVLHEQKRSKEDVYDYIVDCMEDDLELQMVDINDAYDAWCDDHSSNLAILETSVNNSSIELIAEANDSAELLNVTDTFLKDLIMNDKPKRKTAPETTPETTFPTISLKQILLCDQELKARLLGSAENLDANKVTLGGEEFDATASWQQVSSHIVKNRLKSLESNNANKRSSPEMKAKFKAINSELNYQEKVIQLNYINSCLSDSTSSSNDSSHDCTDCSCDKHTSFYKCTGTSEQKISLATRESELMSSIELAKTIITDGYLSFHQLSGEFRTRKNQPTTFKRSDII